MISGETERAVQPRRWLERADSWVRARPWAPDTLLALVLALFFGVFSLGIGLTQIDLPWTLPTLAALGILHLSLAFRRMAPEASFIAVAAALAVQAFTSHPLLPSDALFALSLYSVSAYGRKPAPGIALAVGLAGAVIATFKIVLMSDPSQMSLGAGAVYATFFAFLVSVVLASWSIGLFRRVRFAYISTLEDRARRAEAEREERARRAVVEERARIAREMHDVVAHSLAVIVSQAQGGQYASRTNPERATEVLGTIAEAGRQALADMRGLLAVLRTEETAGLPSVDRNPQPDLAALPELLNRVENAGLPIRFASTGHPQPLGPARELAIFRVVQESLTNTIKHAGPGVTADINLDWGPTALTIKIIDDGRGPTPADPLAADEHGSGHGLVGMRERLAVLGGSVSASARAGGGFVVHAQVPYRPVHGRV